MPLSSQNEADFTEEENPGLSYDLTGSLDRIDIILVQTFLSRNEQGSSSGKTNQGGQQGPSLSVERTPTHALRPRPLGHYVFDTPPPKWLRFPLPNKGWRREIISVLGLTISRLGRGFGPKRLRAGKTRRIEDISNTTTEILGFILLG